MCRVTVVYWYTVTKKVSKRVSKGFLSAEGLFELEKILECMTLRNPLHMQCVILLRK